MENLRDLVTGQSCNDGTSNYRNPLAKFVDSIYKDTSQREQEEWQTFEEEQHLNTSLENKLETQTSNFQNHVENFLGNFSNEHSLNTLDPLNALDEIEEYQNFLNEEKMFPNNIFEKFKISNQIPNDILNQYIKSFIDSVHSQQTFRPIPLPELGLSDIDKMKIRDRTNILARHIYSNQNDEFINSQLNSFLSSFGHISQISEPSKFQTPYMVNEFENFNRTHARHSLSYNEMEKYFQESQKTQNWVNDFQQHQAMEEFQKYFEEAKMIEEWEGKRPIEKFSSNLKDLTHSITQIDDPKLQNSNFMKFMNKVSKGEVEFVDNQVIEKNPEEFQTKNWVNEFNNENHQLNQEEKWAEEFQSDNWLNEFDQFINPVQMEWLKEYNMLGSSNSLSHYEFSDVQNNPYINHPEPFQKGIELFHEGNISDAILALEAELQKNPENSKCWFYLGQAHAENDKDSKAIPSLLKAIESDPQNREALMALAVSYTNDLYKDQALDTLKQWIENHPDYKHIPFKMPNFGEGYNFDLYHQAISNMFIEAARLKPNEPDAEVQTALGLLYNLSLEYDKAVDCFKAALNVKPNDYLLWNKLGATLANSNRSDEALGCYFTALKIKPSYVRARTNLGISYMALKEFEKAAQYFLGALSMHPEAKHIWANLQMVFISMGREDLVEKTTENNIELFRKDFEF